MTLYELRHPTTDAPIGRNQYGDIKTANRKAEALADTRKHPVVIVATDTLTDEVQTIKTVWPK